MFFHTFPHGLGLPSSNSGAHLGTVALIEVGDGHVCNCMEGGCVFKKHYKCPDCPSESSSVNDLFIMPPKTGIEFA